MLVVVEVVAQISVVCRGRSDGDDRVTVVVRPTGRRRICSRRYRLAWALAPGMIPGFTRLSPLCSGTVDGGSVSGLAPGTAVGEVEEPLHADPPLLVDLGVVGARGKLHQGLGSHEGVVTSFCVCGEGRAGISSDALLTLTNVGVIGLLPDSGILIDVAVDALLPS